MEHHATDPRIEGQTLVVQTEHGPEVFDVPFLVATAMIFVAQGDNVISDLESAKMFKLLEAQYSLSSAESLELLNRALASLSDYPELPSMLRELSTVLGEQEKEDIALMLLRVIAIDGRRHVGEMEHMSLAADVIDITPEVLHKAHSRYFEMNPS